MKRKNIVVGVTGGIAAYKIPELIRLLTADHWQVVTILTEAGRRFVTEATLSAVSGNRVRSDLWDQEAERAMSHIELARTADILLIAPATADFIAKMALGTSDDLLSTVYSATDATVIVAPAMNQQMWLHRATQRNVAQLLNDGVQLLGPVEGDQACGDTGIGRMVEPEDILNYLITPTTGSNPLSGLTVLVSAGPTREYLDPVRYLSNSSSGKQGYAVALAALQAGAEVTLISGPVAIDVPHGVRCIKVSSSAEMHAAVLREAPHVDIFFSVAAVADFRPRTQSEQKIKRSHQSAPHDTQLDLIATDDIVHAVSRLENRPFLVGFAAETENHIEHAKQKLHHKQLDVIVVNDVSRSDIGMDTEDNEVVIITSGTEQKIPKTSKANAARKLVELVSQQFEASKAVAN